MKRTINTALHSIGGFAICAGFILMIKAAGMADLGGDFAELVHISLSGAAMASLGAVLMWWRA